MLITSSIAATIPGPYQAVYNASESFVQSFAEALRNELKDTGVTVTTLMPGPTGTKFFDRAEMGDIKVGTQDKDDPATVAAQGFAAMMKGEEKVVAGSLKNKVQAVAARLTPDRLMAGQHRRVAEPGSAD
ncbi:SDR family NAD(P)-dependent oxidoreductase [Micromonospora sp. WMMD708]|uniref:SDR family NAD(P)-dependent oxidoreductase n=1 Tax=Micromonospora sp. WMMD708 TaxID=3403464 RepID=UPI003BF5517B